MAPKPALAPITRAHTRRLKSANADGLLMVVDIGREGAGEQMPVVEHAGLEAVDAERWIDIISGGDPPYPPFPAALSQCFHAGLSFCSPSLGGCRPAAPYMTLKSRSRD